MTHIDVYETDHDLWVPGGNGDEPERVLVLPPDAVASGLQIRVNASAEVNLVSAVEGIIELVLCAPADVALTALVPATDATAWWTPGSAIPHTTIPPLWASPTESNPFESLPIGALTRRDDETALVFAGDAGALSLTIRAGLIEETATFGVMVRVPRSQGHPVRIRLDVSGRPFSRATTDAGKWLGAPYQVRRSAGALDPVLCTWYFAHLDVTQQQVLAQADAASAYGFGTVIIDDGWQTEHVARGYATCGDWVPSPTKFGDPRALVEALHERGLRTLWWIGTPFLGHRSHAIGSGLAVLADEPDLEAAVLDPRDPATRRHLVARVGELLASTGADGVKLDFLERFGHVGPEDQASVTQAALGMLQDIVAAATSVVDDPLIEFREPYIHPILSQLSTMIRVGDCPMSPVQNRLGIIDMRLAVPGNIVHSDPVMWGSSESDARVAQHLANALFGVPQISVDLTTLGDGHAQTLAFWLQLWREHRDVLLEGELTAHAPEQHYPLVSAVLNGRMLIARYAAVTVPLTDGWSEARIVNADWSPLIVVCDQEVRAELVVRDPRGQVVDREVVDWSVGAHVVDVPAGGVAELKR
jgi:alpha-galactosidase